MGWPSPFEMTGASLSPAYHWPTKKSKRSRKRFGSSPTNRLARLRNLAGKLCFTQTAGLGRFGTAALRPIYELIAKGGCKLSPDGGSGRDHATFDPKLGRSGLFGAIPNLLRRHWKTEISARPMESSTRWLPQPIRFFLWTTELPAQLLRPEQRKSQDLSFWSTCSSTRYSFLDGESTDRSGSCGPPAHGAVSSLSKLRQSKSSRLYQIS